MVSLVVFGGPSSLGVSDGDHAISTNMVHQGDLICRFNNCEIYFGLIHGVTDIANHHVSGRIVNVPFPQDVPRTSFSPEKYTRWQSWLEELLENAPVPAHDEPYICVDALLDTTVTFSLTLADLLLLTRPLLPRKQDGRSVEYNVVGGWRSSAFTYTPGFAPKV